MTNLFHTDSLLRKHGLLVRQEIRKGGDRFHLVDYQTYELAAPERVAAYEAEDAGK